MSCDQRFIRRFNDVFYFVIQKWTFYVMPKSNKRRSPESWAKQLLKENEMLLKDISSLTGLNIHKVFALKLKMRS